MAVVYAVVCSMSGKAYVGYTGGKLSKRLREHRCLCNIKKHHSPKFQEEAELYGFESFSIISLQEVDNNTTLETKRKAELKWIEFYDEKGLLLNEAKVSFAPTPEATRKGIEASRTVAGRRWTAEANKARSDAQKGIPKNHGAKISATKRAKKLLLLTK